ncbi:MAG: triose-phosphate isomerase [Chloroflexi bacterium]|jgi:triosephosphate isomerase (TIM)|nr:triose-phosphate isomerase [Chloroflexota bacterium]
MTDRTPVIAGNWKMNTDVESGIKLVEEILALSDTAQGVEKIVCPPFISLTSISQSLAGTSIQVGAQNVSANVNGAFTGEVSTSMLNDLVSHVIVGHSERRAMNGETSADVAAKAIAAVDAGLVAILCIGEDLGVRKSGRAAEFVSAQLEESLAGFSQWDSLIVAYEPVWAIGTGEAATSDQAQEMTAVCRDVVRKLSPQAADSVRVLYGGSVNSGNVTELLAQPDIDGALVGGASLKADEFSKLILAASSN